MRKKDKFQIPHDSVKVRSAMKIRKPSVKMKRYKMLDGTSKVLVQQVGDGSIIKRFEKTPNPVKDTDVVCPHFLELKWGYGCPFNCAWCYLKGTLRFLPTQTKPIVKDFRKIERHIKAFFGYNNGPPEILNTGEIADSLMYENKDYPFSEFVMSLFKRKEKHKVLFLTKSPNVKNLLDINTEKSRIIMSFSINAEKVAERWEKAPHVWDRIKAASMVNKAGYETRIRIDPIVPIYNWKEDYLKLIDVLFEALIPERITFGSLRGLQSTINEASDKSWVNYLSENSNWGKKVSFQTRYLIYSTLIDYLKKKYHYTDVALCKETKKMWNALNLNYQNIKCNCVR